MSSFHSCGCSRMKVCIISMHSGSCRSITSMPLARMKAGDLPHLPSPPVKLRLFMIGDLGAVDVDGGGRDEPEADFIAADVDDFDFDVMTDHDRLVAMPREDKHGRLLPGIRVDRPAATSLSRAIGRAEYS